MQQQDYEIDAWDRIEGIDDPRSANKLVGHDDSFAFLAARYAQNNMHHAWLLSGPRGIGKATFAFRFAEHLLRANPNDAAPSAFEKIDDAVHSQVSKGGHPNVLVLRRPWEPKQKKFKTQLTVEEVRRTLGFFGTASGANAWRICIVDPADDLNSSAANALLKILEEPPERTIFFVLSHSPRGLLPTIRSRCQTLKMNPLSDDLLTDLLKEQGVTNGMADKEVGKLVSLSKGSVRRAIILSQSKAIQNFENFISAINKPNADMSKIHQLAGSLSTAKMADEYRLFFDLMFDHLSELIRKPEILQNPIKQVAVSKIWQDTQEHMDRAQEWNMDKKQVVLTLHKNLQSV